MAKGKYIRTPEIREKMRVAQTGKRLSTSTIEKLKSIVGGSRNPMFGKKQSEKTRKLISLKATGRKRSEESKKKQGNSLRGKYVGDKHWAYIKDRSKLKIDKRSGPPYEEWRLSVWLRDNFKCKIANPDCNGRIEAHHILP